MELKPRPLNSYYKDTNGRFYICLKCQQDCPYLDMSEHKYISESCNEICVHEIKKVGISHERACSNSEWSQKCLTRVSKLRAILEMRL